MTPGIKYRFRVDHARCLGRACLLCERHDRLPDLITRYSGHGIVTSWYMRHSEIAGRLMEAMRNCPEQAITMEMER